MDGVCEPKFRIGDLVRGVYDFEITYCFEKDEAATRIFYGVIVDCGEANIFFPYGHWFYQVLCTDGGMRYFTEWEINKV